MKEKFMAPEMEIIEMEKDVVFTQSSGECESGDPMELDFIPEIP